LSAGDGKRTNSEARRLDDDDRTRVQIGFDWRQIRQEQDDLVRGPSRCRASEQHDGGLVFLADGQESPEFGVSGDHDAIFGCRSFEDDRIVRRAQADVPLVGRRSVPVL
jgi:hypothetical protein